MRKGTYQDRIRILDGVWLAIWLSNSRLTRSLMAFELTQLTCPLLFPFFACVFPRIPVPVPLFSFPGEHIISLFASPLPSRLAYQRTAIDSKGVATAATRCLHNTTVALLARTEVRLVKKATSLIEEDRTPPPILRGHLQVPRKPAKSSAEYYSQLLL